MDYVSETLSRELARMWPLKRALDNLTATWRTAYPQGFPACAAEAKVYSEKCRALEEELNARIMRTRSGPKAEHDAH